ncbi:hypothetical protein BST63_16480 [Bradyrhizobium canariense]|uniref:Uncharacterized protein n=2 Tax=Nitrobacteraceae TaxID=41294 RepID=A0ABX3X315_9BRAD|nr:hypothetical protein BSR47_21025 [Bradyrhizobium canariense]OSJ28752.1 hypothetical protein BST63_16480 [Bradyrhizobium canariense]
MDDWEPIDSPSKGVDSVAKPAQKADRVAEEFVKVAKKYASDSDTSSGQSLEHSTLVRAKKKGSLDSDVNSKTFVLSGNKIVGSQG